MSWGLEWIDIATNPIWATRCQKTFPFFLSLGQHKEQGVGTLNIFHQTNTQRERESSVYKWKCILYSIALSKLDQDDDVVVVETLTSQRKRGRWKGPSSLTKYVGETPPAAVVSRVVLIRLGDGWFKQTHRLLSLSLNRLAKSIIDEHQVAHPPSIHSQ